MSTQRSIVSIAVFAVVYAAISLVITNSYYQLIMTLVLVWAVFGLSWNLLSGYTGLISFGHAAFFGIGAYTTALGQIYFDLSPWLLIPIAAMLGGLAGLLIGYPTFRLQGHYFALAMLAYPLAILYVFEWLGFQEVTLPIKRDNPIAYMQFSDPRLYTMLALVMLIGTIVLTRAVERSRFGMALLAIKQNQAAAEAAGINTLAWKLRAISLSGAIAGAIGAFYAVVLLVVTPQSVFGMLVSAQALTVAMFGGVGTVWGPVIGSVILIPLAETLNAEAGSCLPGIQGVIFGLAIICVILLAPEGLFWKVRDILRRRQLEHTPPRGRRSTGDGNRHAASGDFAARSTRRGRDVILEVRNLSRSFGGLKAVQDVSFKLQAQRNSRHHRAQRRRQDHAVQPPQRLPAARQRRSPARGPRHVRPQAARALRSGRRANIPDHAAVSAHVDIGQCRGRRLCSRENRYGGEKACRRRDRARRPFATIADRIAGELSTKELRLMELARALAGQPQILLLDETLAGLGHDEADEVVAVIQRLARDNMTIAIIEHTMQAMVRLVDNFLVLDHGAVLVEGKPEHVTRDTQGHRGLSRQKMGGPCCALRGSRPAIPHVPS